MAAFIETFLGTNGDSWNSTRWPTTGVYSGMTLDIQSNEGHMEAGPGTDRYVAAVAQASTSVQDGELLIKITPDSGSQNQWLYLCFRSSGNIQTGGNAGRPSTAYYYRVKVSNDNTGTTDYWYRRISNSESSSLATGGNDRTAATTFWIRAQVEDVGGDVVLRSRTWDDGDSEPGVWDIEYTDTSPGALHGTAGVLQLVLRNYDGGNTSDISVDDIYFDQIGGSSGTNVTVASTGCIAKSVTATPTVSTPAGTAIEAQGTNVHGAASTAPWSTSHTLVAGTNRIVIVAVGIENQSDVGTVSATYGGVAMTLAAQAKQPASTGWQNASAILYILETDLPSNGSQTVEVTWSGTKGPGAIDANFYVAQYQNVAQTVPDDTDAAAGTANPISNTVTAVSTDLVVSAVSVGNSGGTYTWDNSQNELLDFNDASSVFAVADLIATGSISSLNSSFTGSVNRHARVVAVWGEATSTTNATTIATGAIGKAFSGKSFIDTTSSADVVSGAAHAKALGGGTSVSTTSSSSVNIDARSATAKAMGSSVVVSASTGVVNATVNATAGLAKAVADGQGMFSLPPEPSVTINATTGLAKAVADGQGEFDANAPAPSVTAFAKAFGSEVRITTVATNVSVDVSGGMSKATASSGYRTESFIIKPLPTLASAIGSAVTVTTVASSSTAVVATGAIAVASGSGATITASSPSVTVNASAGFAVALGGALATDSTSWLNLPTGTGLGLSTESNIAGQSNESSIRGTTAVQTPTGQTDEVVSTGRTT